MAFFAVVALAPLPFGSVDPRIIALWCVILGLALGVAPTVKLGTEHLFLIGMGVAVVAAYAFVLHEQTSMQPWTGVAPNHVWQEASVLLGEPLHATIAIAANQPYLALGAPLACILALANGLAYGTDKKSADQLLKVIAWSCACYAVYGIAQTVGDPTRIFWWQKEAYTSVLTGTFINRNTAAVYFGSGAVLWLLFGINPIRRWKSRPDTGWRDIGERLISELPKAVMLPFLAMLGCLTAMFMTGSRAGVILSLLALMLAFLLYLRRQLPGYIGLLVAAGGCLGAVLLTLQFFGEVVVDRFDAQGLAEGGRLGTYHAVARMIAAHPWLGTGQGTFAFGFPAFRGDDVSIMGVWDIAHSTPLEIAAELGLPVCALVIVCWLVMLAVLFRGATAAPPSGSKLSVAAVAVALLAVLHSLIDFSLQISGYAIVALALVGAGLARSAAARGLRSGSFADAT